MPLSVVPVVSFSFLLIGRTCKLSRSVVSCLLWQIVLIQGNMAGHRVVTLRKVSA